MIRFCKLAIILLTISIAAAGCWNLKEPDRLAYVMGTGIDRTSEGQFQLSSLIAIPAGIGGQEFGSTKESFFVVSATGKNSADATQNIQNRLSRNLFAGHRETILIGERMAEQGLANWVDEFFRNPKSEIRSDLLLVKGAAAKDILNMRSVFDPYITTTLNNEQDTRKLEKCRFGDFLAIVLGQGMHPLVPAVEITETNHHKFAGLAVLDKENELRLAGYLDPSEAIYAKWIDDRLDNYVMTVSDSHHGMLSVNLRGMKRRIRTRIDENGGVHASIKLLGRGIVVENNSTWEPGEAQDIVAIEAALNNKAKSAATNLISKAQSQFRLDLLGIGNSVYKQHPYKWKTISMNWRSIFPKIDISVDADIRCMNQGLTSSVIFSD